MKKIKCPYCNSKNIADILYGMPAFNEQMKKDIEDGKLVLGGCCVDERNPDYHCNDCGREFSEGDSIFVFFWQLGEENDIYSNWYPAEFIVEGIKYATTEQYIMAKKALLLGDTRAYNSIMSTVDPNEAKQFGRAAKDYNGKLDFWKVVRQEVAFNGNLAKFKQNADLYYAMLATGDKLFAEASPVDNIWGIGMAADNPDIEDPEKWQGENLQGKVLDAVKAEIRREYEE